MTWGWVHRRAMRVLCIGAGVLLVLVGIVGIVVPLMPGPSLVWLGLVLLVPGSWAAKWPQTVLRRIAARYPRLARRFPQAGRQDTAGPERAAEGQTAQSVQPGQKDAPAS